MDADKFASCNRDAPGYADSVRRHAALDPETMLPRTAIYRASGNCVFVHGQHFLTVHPTDSDDVTPDEQAKILADLLNREYRAAA
jgi:hypothetical protein